MHRKSERERERDEGELKAGKNEEEARVSEAMISREANEVSLPRETRGKEERGTTRAQEKRQNST